jgi:hypothetical protein
MKNLPYILLFLFLGCEVDRTPTTPPASTTHQIRYEWRIQNAPQRLVKYTGADGIDVYPNVSNYFDNITGNATITVTKGTFALLVDAQRPATPGMSTEAFGNVYQDGVLKVTNDAYDHTHAIVSIGITIH